MATTIISPGPICIETIDRISVRELVASESKYLAEVAQSGGNVHQAALDRQDVVMAYIATLSTDEAMKFGDLYAEESLASAKDTNDKAATINAETSAKLAENARVAGNIGIWISLLVIFLLLITVIKTLR